MSSIIELNATSCRNCYKCIRECPIKSISFQEGKAAIIDSECILCGTCIVNCPQNAKHIRDDTELIRKYIKNGDKVYFSVAPSWRAWFDGIGFRNLSAALKKLGAAGVEETAIGAAKVTEEYEKLLAQGKMKNIIVTACASLVLLVEKKFPQLLPMLAPVSSPMTAHARLMKKAYGEEIKVVFVGPCYSKKAEAEEKEVGADLAVTFKNLEELLKKNKIDFSEEDGEAFGVIEPTARLYPKPHGIIETVKRGFGKYTPVGSDGLENCLNALGSMASGAVENIFLEANICVGGCVGGPNFKAEEKSLLRGINVSVGNKRARDANPAPSAAKHADFSRVFTNKMPDRKKPTEAQIKEILLRTGKVKKSDELNCGCCGYPTCRQKAEAVFYGKADIDMCMPFFRSRAENVSNTVIEHSPSGIVAFDEDECVMDMNIKAEEIFGVSIAEGKGKPIPAFFGDKGFESSRKTGEPHFETVKLETSGLTIEKTVLYLKEHKMYIAFIKDVTAAEKQKEELEGMQKATRETAQKVIDKQMRVVQEIASLLGETAAETKVALKKLIESDAKRNG